MKKQLPLTLPIRCSAVYIVLAFYCLVPAPVHADQPIRKLDPSTVPANEWVLLHSEDSSGGKSFASVIYADNVDRFYLWGTGGKKPARNVYQRYELEDFSLGTGKWKSAFPLARQKIWTEEKFPPFRIYGQSGPDGLKYDEGPRLQVVSGYHSTNRIRWWDFDGVKRPSPIHTFNMACWDSKRQRIVYYSDGVTFALDPKTNQWQDLKAKNYPATCLAVAWANMCYDQEKDRVMLFGGGLATNPQGAAPTWFYDCQKNEWQRPTLETEPPARCNAALAYDPKTNSIVLFGGYDQSAALCDTWIYDCEENRWQKQNPRVSPPPMSAPAGTLLPGHGKILVCGNDARKVKFHHKATTSATKETWCYDIKANRWTPLDGDLNSSGYRWLTATASAKHDLVLLVAFGPERRTYAFRYDPTHKPAKLPGAKPGAVAWKYPEQHESLRNAPPADPAAHKKLLETLPVNTFVDAKPPGMLIGKTWSTAVLDSDRSEVIYTGGGHSGYSGNDFARYDIATNRWSLDAPPRFPPFLEGTNAGIFAWSYGMIPFSQHTYLWYCYDPLSKSVVYLARPSLRNGIDVQLGDDPKDVFVYDSKKHGYATWIYDSAKKKIHRPSFGRPFDNPWHLSLVGTPEGVYALCRNETYLGKVEAKTGEVDWKLVDRSYPSPPKKIKYHYEFQPVLYDSKRNRLLQLKGDSERVDIYARSLDKESKWELLKTEGNTAIGREAVYLAKHDVVVWVGKKLYVYDCATRSMSQVEVEFPKGIYGHECALVYDSKHDVCVALIPSRFTGPMQTFLFRYDPTRANQ